MEEIKKIILYFEDCGVMTVPIENIVHLKIGDKVNEFEEHELQLEINKIDGITTEFDANPIDVIKRDNILGISTVCENGHHMNYNIIYLDGDGFKNICQVDRIYSFNHIAVEISYEAYENKLLHEKNKLEEKLKKINKDLLDIQNKTNYN